MPEQQPIPQSQNAPPVQAPVPQASQSQVPPNNVAQAVPVSGVATMNMGWVDMLLEAAVKNEASDIYVVANYYPGMKISGKIVYLSEGFSVLTGENVEEFANTLMTDEQKEEYLNELELDFAYTHQKTSGRFRVNVFRQMNFPSVALRYLRSDIPSLDSLGLPPVFKWLAERPSGIILLAGPTGSGKSTTLSAMVDYINTNFIKHIITIEDPVEYLHPLKKSIVEQREVGTDTHSFARAMKSALRQNPNVLVLGEMRDLESISSAITMAETGHLVFSTIHARSSVQTINKIIDSFPAEQQAQIRQQISETLLSVVSQRLVPRVDGEAHPAMAMEIMILNSAIANMVREEQTHQIESVIQTGKKEGMILLDDDLLRLIQEGKISVDSALQHSNSPQSLQSKLISLGLIK